MTNENEGSEAYRRGQLQFMNDQLESAKGEINRLKTAMCDAVLHMENDEPLQAKQRLEMAIAGNG